MLVAAAAALPSVVLAVTLVPASTVDAAAAVVTLAFPRFLLLRVAILAAAVAVAILAAVVTVPLRKGGVVSAVGLPAVAAWEWLPAGMGCV